MKTGVYYKVLGLNGVCYHGGQGTWHLASNGKPGRWMPRLRGKLVHCKHGYHVLILEHLLRWLGPAIHLVEAEEPVLWDGDKGVTRRARDLGRIEGWNERTALLFAADCAEHVLPLFEARFPDDARPRQAIEAARAFARGEIDREAGRAAREAAWAAWAAWVAGEAKWVAGEAAWAAWEAKRAAGAAWAAGAAGAREAAGAAWAAREAAWAAWEAAGAAREAAGVAGAAAAREAEKAWQLELLGHYLAASSPVQRRSESGEEV